MELFNSRRITNIGVMTAIYVVATLLCAPFAYKEVQFRISEILMLFCFFNKDYVISLTLGCFIVNLWSPMGYLDVAFGTIATVIAAILIYLLRKRINLFVASLFPVVMNGLLIGAELNYVYKSPFWLNAALVALGEFVCVSIIGVIVVSLMKKNNSFMKLVMAGTDIKQTYENK